MASEMDLNDYNKHRGMVRWFRPQVLLDAARRAIISALFGEYADGRLIQAALDPVTDDSDFKKRFTPGEGKDGITPVIENPAGETWIDYVADLGDGFDSTYAIAYLLAQDSIGIGEKILPRGQLLVMGGDQVYPVATRDEYENRMKNIYKYAFPNDPNGPHPPLFVIPGNHDWYDGLNLFLANFCRGIVTKIGSWRSLQHRSYFAFELPNNWWVWGVDTQLAEDVDAPQAKYFQRVAAMMPTSAKLIICTPVPSWLEGAHSKEVMPKTEDWGEKFFNLAEKVKIRPLQKFATKRLQKVKEKAAAKKEKFYMGLDFIANIAKKADKDIEICAVLSGDTHHYSRYSLDDASTQFITAGGGGAFLHPTHHLTEELDASWLGEKHKFFLNTEPASPHKITDHSACYPDQQTSRRLSFNNWMFPINNWDFCLILAAGYFMTCLFISVWSFDELKNSVSFDLFEWSLSNLNALPLIPVALVATGLFFALKKYADASSGLTRILWAGAHTIGHMILIIGCVCVLSPLMTNMLGVPVYWDIGSAMSLWLIPGAILAGFLGGLIWGIYLIVANGLCALHFNDAFSALKMDSFRHFLRICITKDKLTIYPIGINRAPERSQWKVQAEGVPGSMIIPINGALTPILIEKEPITIFSGRGSK